MGQKLIDEAEQKGMEISEAKFKLRDVGKHGYNHGQWSTRLMKKSSRKSLITELKSLVSLSEESKSAIHEYYFRRFGLVISTLIITLLAISLYMYTCGVLSVNKSALCHSH